MRDAVFEALGTMEDFLEQAVRRLGPGCHVPAPDGGFSLVEHVWHLADLESEGFGVRIDRLLHEESPFLPDFEGDRIARERNYRSREASQGLTAFRVARDRNLSVLRDLSAEELSRAGNLEGFGPITLADILTLMAEHDASHREEIGGLVEGQRS